MKGDERMDKVPVLAEIAVSESGDLMVWLNDSIAKKDMVKVALACSQAFTGYAIGLLDKPDIIVPGAIV